MGEIVRVLGESALSSGATVTVLRNLSVPRGLERCTVTAGSKVVRIRATRTITGRLSVPLVTIANRRKGINTLTTLNLCSSIRRTMGTCSGWVWGGLFFLSLCAVFLGAGIGRVALVYVVRLFG